MSQLEGRQTMMRSYD